MKLIKKIAAIMFAFMMVVSMSCNVKADDATTTTGETGTITINNAVDGQTYTIYKLLDLESYEPKKNEQGEEIGNYSYKPNKDWNNFISTAIDSAGNNYFDVDENGYARWNVDKTKTAEFAQKALAYAKDKTHPITGASKNKEKGVALTFENLSLGYYLVESSVGALCSLDTTNPNITIQEKNGVPSVDKTITSGGVLATDYKSNSVNIGDTITFQTTIHVQKGAKSYVLTDKMSDGLKLKDKYSEVFTSALHVEARNDDGSINDVLEEGTHYDLTKTSNGFIISFRESYLKTHENEKYQITVTYAATLTEAAVIGGAGNTNETYLKYGVSSESTPSTTTTYTFGIPVFKYTGTEKKALAGAKFKLYTDAQCKDENVIKVKVNGTNYIVGETDGNNNVMTSGTEVFYINGLKAGTYYLKEIEAPKGYNKLANAIKVEITNDGKVKVEENGALTDVTQVDVENKTGTVLPSTGGMGTTMIYLVGAVLVLGSGVVLVTKRRVKDK
mgnify:CR=1 FL=1